MPKQTFSRDMNTWIADLQTKLGLPTKPRDPFRTHGTAKDDQPSTPERMSDPAKDAPKLPDKL